MAEHIVNMLVERSIKGSAVSGFLVPALNGTLINKNLCTLQICSLEYAEVRYLPSFGGNLAYLIIFAAFLIVQLGMGIHFRTWGFLVGTACGCLLEIAGYVGRLLLHNNDFDFNNFIIYLVCLTLAPAFMSASIYLCLSRLINACGASIARFSPKLYTLVFMGCDFLSLVLQAIGGAIAATSKTDSGRQAGVNIMIAGLAFQVASLFLYMILGVDFILAVRRASRNDMDPRYTAMRSGRMFKLFPYALALATITIFIRCVFRVAELEKGFRSSIANDEVLFMIFEGPMIMIAMLCLTVCHPGFILGGRDGWQELSWSWKERKSVMEERKESQESLSMGSVQESSYA